MNSEGDSSSIKSVPEQAVRHSLSTDMNQSLSFATQNMTCYMMLRYVREHRTVCNLSAHTSMLFTTMSTVNFGS